MSQATGNKRYCDVVMKGGVTSGIVYPRAISKLSEEYSLKNIGGTSAGAIAAVAAAAAEYQRRHTASVAGFRALEALPDELAEEDESRMSKLFRLFRPQAATRPLFSMLVAGLNRDTLLSRAFHVFVTGVLVFWRYSGTGALALGGLAWWSSAAGEQPAPCAGGACLIPWIPTVLLTLIGALAGLGYGIYRCLSQHVVDNGFGLCKGMGGYRREWDETAEREELTTWMNRLINRLAGLKPNGDPLTFGQLWKAPGFPPAWLQPVPGQSVKSIGLQMVTTNVTHGRPYTLPFDDPDARLFFREEELRGYFPKEVVDWMVAKRTEYQPRGESDPPALPPGLFQAPAPDDLPVVVAARLSLSFPFLISAVPLWAIDYEAPRPERTFRRCWFSDGGISSNFPVHMFDALLPLWPTFGVKLEGFPRSYRSRIYMPHTNTEGRGDFWNRFDDGQGFGRLGGFFGAIIESMMNWNDNSLSRIPGYRDRIVRIRLDENEGGMNLNMPKRTIDTLSKLGALAADEIVSRYVKELPTERGHISMGWENHRWVRLRSLIAILEETIPSLQTALEKQRPGDPGYRGQLVEGTARNPDHYPFPDDVQLKKAVDALKEISDLARVVEPQPHTSHTAPQPLPVLRVRPRL